MFFGIALHLLTLQQTKYLKTLIKFKRLKVPKAKRIRELNKNIFPL